LTKVFESDGTGGADLVNEFHTSGARIATYRFNLEANQKSTSRVTQRSRMCHLSTGGIDLVLLRILISQFHLNVVSTAIL
jgi:hypothetical protein